MKSPLLPTDIFVDETVFITGAGSGINQSIALLLAAHGARVVMIGRRAEKLAETEQMIVELGGQALAVAADVRDSEAMEQAARQGAEHFGPYHMVVAGAAGNFVAPVAAMSSKGFSSVVDIDLKGTFHTFKSCFAHLADGARCLAITAPQSQMPMAFQAHVCAAKAGVDMFVKSLAVEWAGRGVRVNALSPGYVENTVGAELLSGSGGEKIRASVPLKRFAERQEMALMAALMLSPLMSYLTGQVIAYDGGISVMSGSSLMEKMGV